MGGLTSRALSFLRNNARRFGYVNDVPSEDWHWVYYEHIWDGETGEDEDDVKFEKFLDAQEKCLKRYKDRISMGKDGDPGPPPDGMDDPYAVKGWNFMRASLNNPVPHKGDLAGSAIAPSSAWLGHRGFASLFGGGTIMNNRKLRKVGEDVETVKRNGHGEGGTG